MRTYTVMRPTGDYEPRQKAANAAGAALYLEQHINAADDPQATRAEAIVATNASRTSKALAEFYAGACVALTPATKGQSPYRVGGRGNDNLIHTAMPALILEPGFGSNPGWAKWATSEVGIDTLALCLVATVYQALPDGGLVALSVGHIGQDRKPNDRGAVVHGWGREADLAMLIVDRAEGMLQKPLAVNLDRRMWK